MHYLDYFFINKALDGYTQFQQGDLLSQGEWEAGLYPIINASCPYTYKILQCLIDHGESSPVAQHTFQHIPKPFQCPQYL